LDFQELLYLYLILFSPSCFQANKPGSEQDLAIVELAFTALSRSEGVEISVVTPKWNKLKFILEQN